MTDREVFDWHGIWAYVEHENSRVEDASLEILAKGRELAARIHERLTAIVIGKEEKKIASDAVSHGADHVILVNSPVLEQHRTEPYTKVLADLVRERRPNILLVGATRNGRDLAGRLAVRLGTGLTANVVRLDIEKETGLLLGGVPGFGGRILAMCKCPRDRPQMATVRPGIFKADKPDPARKADIEEVSPSIGENEIHTWIVDRKTSEFTDISQIKRLVIAGNGTGGDLSLVKELADLIDGGIGVTRPLADAGIISRDHQIGSTGLVVKPRIVLVLGVSGDAHFVSGIEQAETVVAINSDPEAEIFQYADYCLVDDLFKVVPSLIAQLKSRGG